MTVSFFSGGLCSFLATHRWMESTGERPPLLFSDTGIEDPDLYRFLDDASKFFGCELVRLQSERTFDEMILKHRALPNDRMPFCSQELKVMPCEKWMKSHPEADTIIVGLDWTETHRLPKTQERWSPRTVVAPMMEKPYLLKAQMISAVREMGVEPPRLYELGFHHNNCGGACVRNGKTAWKHLMQTLPEVYAEAERRESLIPGYSFMRDRKTGESLTLKQFREDQSGDLFDWGGCGCFIE